LERRSRAIAQLLKVTTSALESSAAIQISMDVHQQEMLITLWFTIGKWW
jgi:hypothetical protein